MPADQRPRAARPTTRTIGGHDGEARGCTDAGDEVETSARQDDHSGEEDPGREESRVHDEGDREEARTRLLEYDAPSPELREHLTRLLTAPDLFVRSSATAAARGLAREHALWALELAAGAETDPTLREMDTRTAEAERAKRTPTPET